MRLLMTFRTYTKQVGINTTFRDASSRTSALKKSSLDTEPKRILHKSLVDKNGTSHRVGLLRRSGGIPKKCSLSSC